MTSLSVWWQRSDLLTMLGMEVATLRDVAVSELTALFQEEASHWKEQLHWEYEPTLQLVGKLVGLRTLPGFVLKHEKQIVGYSYYVVDRPVGFVGGLYVLDDFAQEENYHLLIENLVKAMQGTQHLERIESQVMPFNAELASGFVGRGFRALPRFFLSAPAGKRTDPLATSDKKIGEEFQIGCWRSELMLSAAEVIYDSYIDSPDGELCRDYQSNKGCTRFLRNLVESPACGKFSQNDTRVAWDRSGQLCGILLASMIDKTAGMVPQLSVRRDCQGKGLGSSLLTQYLQVAGERGLERVSLSVSKANTRAYDLYRRLGFEIEKQFHAFIWEQQPGEIPSV